MKTNPDAPKIIGISASKWTLVRFPVGVNAIPNIGMEPDQ